jgi:DNA-3-methyladenine glycosylase II
MKGGGMRLPGPLDLPASLEGFRRWGDDLIDRWDGRRLVRGGPPSIAVDVVGPDRVSSVPPGNDAATVAALEAMVIQEPLAELASEDPVIAALDARHPGVRPVLQLDPLTAVIRSISAQQVNLRWACTTRRRLVERFGSPHDTGGGPAWSYDVDRLASADPPEVRALQFTTRKAEHIVAAARLAATGGLELASFRSQADDEIVARLTAMPGVGRWTAEWFLARTLGRPVVVAGDLAVRKAFGLAYLGGRLPSEQDVRRLSHHWGAAAGVAQQLLLHAFSEGTLPAPAAPAPGARRRGRASTAPAPRRAATT